MTDTDYIDQTIATIRQHNPDALRQGWWTGAALALADEVERLRAEGTPGVMHAVDKAFYDLTVKERDMAWRENERLRGRQ